MFDAVVPPPPPVPPRTTSLPAYIFSLSPPLSISSQGLPLFLETTLHAVLAPVLPPEPSASIAASAADIRSNFPLALLLSLLAGASTGLGGLAMVLRPGHDTRSMGLWQGAAAGFMAAVSCLDLLPSAFVHLQAFVVFFYVVIGACLFLAVKRYIPEPNMDVFISTTNGRPALTKGEYAVARKVLLSGFVTGLGIFIHNFFEGVAVGVSALQGLNVSLPIALGIACHNIPEGIVVASPVYFSTLDRWYTVKVAFLSGMAEPLGVILCYAFLEWTGAVLTHVAVEAMLASVAGVMLAICAVELMPQAVEHCGRRHAFLSLSSGFVAMSIMLEAMDYFGLHRP